MAAAYRQRRPDAAGNGSLMRTGAVVLAHLGNDDDIAMRELAVVGPMFGPIVPRATPLSGAVEALGLVAAALVRRLGLTGRSPWCLINMATAGLIAQNGPPSQCSTGYVTPGQPPRCSGASRSPAPRWRTTSPSSRRPPDRSDRRSRRAPQRRASANSLTSTASPCPQWRQHGHHAPMLSDRVVLAVIQRGPRHPPVTLARRGGSSTCRHEGCPIPHERRGPSGDGVRGSEHPPSRYQLRGRRACRRSR